MFIWLILIALFLFIYQPLVLWEMRGQIPLTPIYVQCLAIIWFFSWLFIPNKRSLGNILTSALFIYTLAMTVSILLSPYANVFNNYYYQTWVGHVVLFVIFITSAKIDKDLKTIIIGFFVIYFVYMAHSYWDFLGGQYEIAMSADGFNYRHRLGGLGGRDSNYFTTGIICTLPLLLPLITLCKKYWHYLFVVGYVCLALRIVLLSGSRGGFIALIILIILPILFSRYRFRILPVILLLVLPLGWFLVPVQYYSRLMSTSLVLTDQVDLSAMGRIDGFYGGLEVWQRYPIIGCGPGSYTRASGSSLDPHNLPGQLAAELGTVGIIAFLCLLSCFGINHYNIWKNYKYLQEKKLGNEGLYCWRVSIAVMYGVAMVLFQGISLHNTYIFFWIWFAAFQALAAMFMQEKVTAAIQGKLLPSLPVRK